MGITLGIVLVLAALAVVVYPFVIVQRRRVNSTDPANSNGCELRGRVPIGRSRSWAPN